MLSNKEMNEDNFIYYYDDQAQIPVEVYLWIKRTNISIYVHIYGQTGAEDPRM